MNTDRLEATLEEEKRKLEGEMSSIGRPNPNIPGDWEPLPSDTGPEPDPLDQAEITTGREEDAGILIDLEVRYAHVCEALVRIKEGTYGTCDVCAKPIEENRLAADPAAITCMAHL